jgi:hypothetical protein
MHLKITYLLKGRGHLLLSGHWSYALELLREERNGLHRKSPNALKNYLFVEGQGSPPPLWPLVRLSGTGKGRKEWSSLKVTKE